MSIIKTYIMGKNKITLSEVSAVFSERRLKCMHCMTQHLSLPYLETSSETVYQFILLFFILFLLT